MHFSHCNFARNKTNKLIVNPIFTYFSLTPEEQEEVVGSETR